MSELTVATTIFVVTYAVIISERLDRAVVALAGAALMIAFGVLDQDRAVAAIDFNTLALLVGMMILVNILKRTGVFRYAGWRTAIAVGGSPWRLMVGFALFTAVASAFLDNVTTILLMVPVTIAICDDLGFDARPFLITQVIASNVGGTATLIGDPPNILIGSATGLDFVAFLANLGPLVALLLPLTIAGFWLAYQRRGRLAAPSPEARRALAEADARVHIGNAPLLRRALSVLALTILGFVLHGVLHLEAGTVAMFGAILLLLLSRADLHGVLAEVEWPTIFFFVGLFVLVGGLEEIGLLDRIARRAVAVSGGDVTLTVLAILWFAAVVSAIVDNIPAVATMIPLTFSIARLLFPELAELDDAALARHAEVAPLWWALALGACLGGNGSLVGASANVVAVGISERRGQPIGFWGFTRVGLPFTLATLVVASLYVWLRYLAFQ
ncbi:MAG: Na+/H+ antiporter NhaD and related arsenite permeases [uncultured Thermomicrobiales bacterium]|uniref:Na+/H+ antiporter NhaD and related arsenite permeases n=1 Tax=uncultured Thermomicrobiales bacterium TaxID=1645740 RepID=A0A6J4VJM2_9BACT|nr:MAG: Na+/H+ antiporter NhaD and related arsenite permeases [uncultured Thermomicrobiales bacterium]